MKNQTSEYQTWRTPEKQVETIHARNWKPWDREQTLQAEKGLKKIEKIARVKTMLEQNIKMDETRERIKPLKEMVEAGLIEAGMIEAGRRKLNKLAFKELNKYEADLDEAEKADLDKAFYKELQ